MEPKLEPGKPYPLTIDEMDKLVEEVAVTEHVEYTTCNRHRPLMAMVWFPCRWKRIGWYNLGILLCGLGWRAFGIQVTVWRFTFLFMQGNHGKHKEAEWKRGHTYKCASIQPVDAGHG